MKIDRYKRVSGLPVRPLVDTQTACTLLAKQFAARRRAWEEQLRNQQRNTNA